MKKRRRSKTAEAAAACRAYHLIDHVPVVFEDPYAIHLTSSFWRVILRSSFLRRLVFRRALRVMDPIGWEIIGRARWAEDRLTRAIGVGVDQYLLLGAGLDSFALRRRDLSRNLRVFELDHPSSQEVKRRRLSELTIDLPENLEFVPVNFEEENLADALARSSFRSERPAFFSWLGVTPYLTSEAIFRTLGSIAAIAAPGSEMVLDYFAGKEHVQPDDLPSVESLERFVARRGEPFMSAFGPDVFWQQVRALGFEVVQQLSPEEQSRHYLAGHDENARTAANAFFVHLRLPD